MKNSELNPNLGGRFRGLFWGQGGGGRGGQLSHLLKTR